MECPKCHAEIGRSAQCGCGWRKNAVLAPVHETVLCGCNLSAKVKVRTDSGWLNLCMGCYYKHHFQQSVDYCNAMGLTTTEQGIAWLKKHAKGITQRYTRNIPAREPGADFEEDAA